MNGESPYYRGSANQSACDRWFDLYLLLSTLPLDDPEVRRNPRTLQRLRNAGWMTDQTGIERYWHRVWWTARHCRGRVLEVGSGMGNVTRWLQHAPAVEEVLALDLDERYVEQLRSFGWPKVTALCADATASRDLLTARGPFDTVVLAELVEHMTVAEELRLLHSIRPHLGENARYVITTPVGYMEALTHVRGFRPFVFTTRSRLLYGPPIAAGENTIQQFIVCRGEHVGTTRRRLLDGAATVLDLLLDTRPSGMPWAPFTRGWRLARRVAGLLLRLTGLKRRRDDFPSSHRPRGR